MSLSEPLPLANAQLELGRSQVIKLEEEMALVIGPHLYGRLVARSPRARHRGRDRVLQVMIMPMSA